MDKTTTDYELKCYAAREIRPLILYAFMRQEFDEEHFGFPIE